MKPAPISDATRAVAARLWTQFPHMRPVGEARQKRHLAELEALLACVSENELTGMIIDLSKSRFTRQWVASFAAIANKLPEIRMVWPGGESGKPSRQSYSARWKQENL